MNKSLEKLYLYSNKIGDGGAIALARALKVRTFIASATAPAPLSPILLDDKESVVIVLFTYVQQIHMVIDPGNQYQYSFR